MTKQVRWYKVPTEQALDQGIAPNGEGEIIGQGSLVKGGTPYTSFLICTTSGIIVEKFIDQVQVLTDEVVQAIEALAKEELEKDRNAELERKAEEEKKAKQLKAQKELEEAAIKAKEKAEK